MKVPGPDHPISVTANPNRITIRFAGKTIADTVRAHSMQEAAYPVVHYIPRQDVDMTALTPTEHTTHCPYKGDAAYWTIAVDGTQAENAVWGYEAPFAAVAEIKDHLAFYDSKVDSIDETAPPPA